MMMSLFLEMQQQSIMSRLDIYNPNFLLSHCKTTIFNLTHITNEFRSQTGWYNHIAGVENVEFL